MNVWQSFDKEEVFALALQGIKKELFAEALAKLKWLGQLPEPPQALDAVLGSLYASLQLFERAKSHLGAFATLTPTPCTNVFSWAWYTRIWASCPARWPFGRP